MFDVFCPMAGHKVRHNRVKMLVSRYAYLLFGALPDFEMNVNSVGDGDMQIELISRGNINKQSRFNKEVNREISPYKTENERYENKPRAMRTRF